MRIVRTLGMRSPHRSKPSARRILSALTILASVVLVACHGSSGTAQTESHAVEMDAAESVTVDLRMRLGGLDVRGGASQLMDGQFTFRPAQLRPEVQYVGGARGRLRVEQPRGSSLGNMFGRSKQRWMLRLNDQKPMDLGIQLAAGEGRLRIGSLNLRSLDIQIGAGKLDVDLRGTPRNGYHVKIQGGVGQATIRLPQDVGIVADIKGGLGEIRTAGLEKRNGQYVNRAYDSSKTTVRFDIQGGVGSITLEGE